MSLLSGLKNSVKEKHKFESERKSIQKNFSIQNYQKKVTEQEQAANPEAKDIPAKVQKRFYGSVISEKMSVWNQLLTWAVLIVVVFFCLVNVSGHSLEHVIDNPVSIVHPSHTLHLPGTE